MNDPTQEEIDRFVEQILKHKPKKTKQDDLPEETEKNGDG